VVPPVLMRPLLPATEPPRSVVPPAPDWPMVPV
jgi:hypothetical protein